MRTPSSFKFFKILLLLGVGLIITCFTLMYLMLVDPTLFPKGQAAKLSIENNEWLHFENRLAKLEELNRQHKVITAIKEASDSIENAIPSFPEQPKNRTATIIKNKTSKPSSCSFNIAKVPEVDIQMLEVYKHLEFDNTDGGVWKQGWNIRYDKKQWHPTRKLQVFVVPHSHNDPGWLYTFENYYTTQTQRILNNMVTKLAEDRRRKFIWAEISYFKMWWDEQSTGNRDLVKRLILDGQLEIVAGGWVMPDEAVSHWMAQLTQLTQGHQWLKTNLDYVPTSGWAIDPFGLSPTMPYLLKGAGLENILIQRVHYSVKKKLARGKNLEFRWRQLWDNEGTSEIFTHMMPFYSYDVPHTCGPDPKVCCQFDFFRLPSFGLTCPWKMPPQVITLGNVAKRAILLLDQYRKKAQLYRSNVVLVPLGDDFRYSQSTEWDAQYGNYQKLFDYLNANDELNVKIQFGTLTDYFNAVRDEKKSLDEFPTLSGDFFTYADRDDHYWSGYYTSRPFHKRLDRVLLGTLRAAEIVAAIGWARGHEHLTEGNIDDKINEARRWHSLFQHHDGVTGTARDNVVIDYAQKMISALKNSSHVIQQSVAHLLRSPQGPRLDPNMQYFTMDEKRSHHTSIGERYKVEFGDAETTQKVIIYNPLPRQQTKVQSFVVSSPYVRVTDRMGQSVQCQISPIWTGQAMLSSNRYELSFLVTVPGFGMSTYLIHALHGKTLPEGVYHANVTLYNAANPPTIVSGFAHMQVLQSSQEFSIGNRAKLSAAFGKTGLLKALRVGNTTFPVHLEFMKYGTRGRNQDRSGAYLFLPDKAEPDPIYTNNERVVHLVSGPILSRVFVDLPHVRHTCTIFNSPGSDGLGLQIQNEVDISETQNFELVMRFDTDIASGDEFFTDLNGLNMVRRQRFPKLPTQGNYYPLAAAGYIEDKRVRMTIVTAQPLGAASMASGQFEIMQDRRLLQDDNRGLSQGVTDNLLTNHIFALVLEKKRVSCTSPTPPSNHPAGMLSLSGHLASEGLLHPLIALHPQAATSFNLNGNFVPLRFDLPVDLSVVNLRVFPVPEGAGKGVGMVLHRQAIDQCWGEDSTMNSFDVSENGEINLTQFLSFTEDWTISEAPLTFYNVGPSIKSPIINVCPHQIASILFHKTQS